LVAGGGVIMIQLCDLFLGAELAWTFSQQTHLFRRNGVGNLST
jgi:hypothetical protein